ncbi:MAG: glycosyl hydrolase family 18 protein [Bacillota bacterium]
MVVLAWLVPDDEASLRSFVEHASAITHVSPTWLRLDASAQLHAAPQPEVLEAARERGAAVVPLVVNEGFKAEVAAAILEDPSRRRKGIDALVRFAESQKAAGINLDFEGPFGAWRHHYTEFVHALAERLHELGMRLSVDVVCQTEEPHPVEALRQPADPSRAGWVASWAEPYDYAALGEAVDQLVLMGYDFHSRLSEPGPVGPVWWLRRVLDYTLEKVPASKVVLGLPFYGRRWVSIGPMPLASWQPPEPLAYRMPRSARDAGFEAAAGLSFAQAKQEAAQATLRERRAVEGSPWAAFNRPDGRLVVVHYDDAESLAGKLGLVREYGLAGCAFWRLGQEDPAVWRHLGA